MAEQERPIRFVCPRCKNPMQASAADGGTVMTCSGCGQKLQIPKPKPPQGIAAAADVPMASRPSAQPPPVPDMLDEPERPQRRERRERDERREHCRECGRDVTERERVRTCPDCDAVLCSSECLRRHEQFAHDGSRSSSGQGVGMAVTGLVLGVVGFVLAFIPCIGWVFSIILGILGTVFSCIGLSQAGKTQQGKGMAITGLILSVLAIIWGPLFYFLILAGIAANVPKGPNFPPFPQKGFQFPGPKQ